MKSILTLSDSREHVDDFVVYLAKKYTISKKDQAYMKIVLRDDPEMVLPCTINRLKKVLALNFVWKHLDLDYKMFYFDLFYNIFLCYPYKFMEIFYATGDAPLNQLARIDYKKELDEEAKRDLLNCEYLFDVRDVLINCDIRVGKMADIRANYKELARYKFRICDGCELTYLKDIVEGYFREMFEIFPQMPIFENICWYIHNYREEK